MAFFLPESVDACLLPLSHATGISDTGVVHKIELHLFGRHGGSIENPKTEEKMKMTNLDANDIRQRFLCMPIGLPSQMSSKRQSSSPVV